MTCSNFDALHLVGVLPTPRDRAEGGSAVPAPMLSEVGAAIGVQAHPDLVLLPAAIPVETLVPPRALPDCEFHRLQKEVTDAGAPIAQMDLGVTLDTMMAHLACSADQLWWRC